MHRIRAADAVSSVATQPCSAPSEVSAMLPLNRRWSIMLITGERASEIELVWMTRTTFDATHSGSSADWRIFPIGPFVIGLRLIV